MPRKRTPNQPTTDTETQPATEAQTEAATATAEPPEAEVPQQTESFVERLQQQRSRSMASDPFGIAGDYEAGIRLFENRKDRLMVIKFEQKPGTDVLNLLKDAGFRWNPRDQVWVHPIYKEEAMRIRIGAERLYQEVRGMIRQERGIEAGPDIPF